MTADELRRAAELLPPGSSVTVPRDAILEAFGPTPDIAPAKHAPADAERWLTVREVAARLGCSTRYVYEHRRHWPFTRELPDGGGVRFSEKGLAHWMAGPPR